MTDPGNSEPGPENEPDFDDPSHAALRNLLGETAGPVVTPEHVVNRLDATLAELVAKRAASADADPVVVPLRRRAALSRRLLIAAAAVVLVGGGGVGMSQVLQGTEQSDTASSTAADSQGLAEAPAPEAATPQMAGDAGSLAGKPPEATKNLTKTYSNEFANRLNSDFTQEDFAAEVAALLAESDGTGRANNDASDGRDQTLKRLNELSSQATNQDSAPCPGPKIQEGDVLLEVRFEGARAVLVVQPIVADSRYIAAWSCDGERLLAFTNISR